MLAAPPHLSRCWRGEGCLGPPTLAHSRLGGTGEGFYPLALNTNFCPTPCRGAGAPAVLPLRDILSHCPTVATFVPTVTPQGLSRCPLPPGVQEHGHSCLAHHV